MKKFMLLLVAIIMCVATVNAASSWTGSYVIEGALYRGPGITVKLTLKSTGANTYAGTIRMDRSGYGGILTGKVTAKEMEGVLFVTLTSFTTRAVDGEDSFKGSFNKNEKIFLISKNEYKYNVIPIGSMEGFMDGLSCENTIEKIR